MKFFLFLSILVLAGCALPKASFIHVDKSERKMTLLDTAQKPIKTYTIALGTNPIGHKVQEGDGKTPEGLYTITTRNPNSKYHLSLYINYPNQEDRDIAKSLGVSPGGDIVIHGRGKGTGWEIAKYTPYGDWTLGCIAVTDREMEEVYASVPDGTPILIEP